LSTSYDGKVQVWRKKSYARGLGIAGGWRYRNASGWRERFQFAIGITPIKGRTVQAINIIDRKKMSSLPGLYIPYSKEGVEKLSAGDKVSYNANGGIAYSVGPAVLPIGLYRTYAAMGTWNVTVQKLAKDKVYVALRKGRIKSYSTSLSHSGVVALDVTKFNGTDKQFSYFIDISSKEGEDAYHDFLKGDMIPTQLLSTQDSKKAIQVRTTERGTFGLSKGIRIGIPHIAHWSSSNSNVYTKGHTVFHPNKTQSDIQYGAFVKNTQTDWFNLDMKKSVAFYGVDFKTSTLEDKKELEKGYFAQFIWSYENDRMTAKKYDRVFKKIRSETGLNNEIRFKVPKNMKKGYGNVSLKSKIHGASLDVLMDMVSGESTSGRTMDVLSEKLVHSYFQSGDEFELCNEGYDDHISTCEDKYSADTERALRKMKVALKQMRKYRGKNQKKFVKNVALFGKYMLKSPFAFQTVYSLLRGRGVNLQLNVQGRYIQALSKNIEWVPVLK
jgi:hypothetical protein